MEFMKEQLTTPVAGRFDVIVVGGGPAGSCAAIAAARRGAKTLLIERQNCLGGMWTSGFINPIFDHENKNGIMRELINELDEKGFWGGFWNESMNYEHMKHLLEQKCVEAGVKLLFQTSFSKAVMEGNTITGVICESVSGRKAYFADFVVDCSGDALCAISAGANVVKENGETRQAMTLMFLVGNVPQAYRNGALLKDIFIAMFKKAGKPLPFNMPYLITSPNSRFGAIQYTHMYGLDPFSAEDLTAAAIEGRRQMIEAVELLKRYDAAFSDLDLICSSQVMGVRESVQVVGEYTLTADDLLSGASFPDGITKAAFNIDIHTQSNLGQDVRSVKPYEIPFRCLIPKGIHHLLVAGKTISGTHEAMASFRVTANCAAMGEAAGIAASHCAKHRTDVRSITIRELIPELL